MLSLLPHPHYRVSSSEISCVLCIRIGCKWGLLAHSRDSCHAHFWRLTWRRSVEIGIEQRQRQIILRWNQFWWEHPNLPCYGHGERVELCPNNISQKLSQLCWGTLPYYPHTVWLLFPKSPHPHSLEFVTVEILQKTEVKKYVFST